MRGSSQLVAEIAFLHAAAVRRAVERGSEALFPKEAFDGRFRESPGPQRRVSV